MLYCRIISIHLLNSDVIHQAVHSKEMLKKEEYDINLRVIHKLLSSALQNVKELLSYNSYDISR